MRTETLDLALRLAELWLRDVLCVCEGAPELVLAVDRAAELQQDAEGCAAARAARARSSWSARRACSLALHVSEELALEALAYRLQELLERLASAPARARASGLISADRPEVRLEAVGLEREEAREQAVLGAVEVGGARAQQPELGAALRRAARSARGCG